MPVLSKITVFILDAVSNISLFFTNIPLFMHTPSLTTIASGVASPKLQGQATTRIVTNVEIAVDTSNPSNKYIINVITEIISTIGTKYPEILSAILA